jgi:hypothetical protein
MAARYILPIIDAVRDQRRRPDLPRQGQRNDACELLPQMQSRWLAHQSACRERLAGDRQRILRIT